MKFLDFFLFFWVNFARLDPESGSGSTDLIEPGSETLNIMASLVNDCEAFTVHTVYLLQRDRNAVLIFMWIVFLKL
jgi:hypothetical protein